MLRVITQTTFAVPAKRTTTHSTTSVAAAASAAASVVVAAFWNEQEEGEKSKHPEGSILAAAASSSSSICIPNANVNSNTALTRTRTVSSPFLVDTTAPTTIGLIQMHEHEGDWFLDDDDEDDNDELEPDFAQFLHDFWSGKERLVSSSSSSMPPAFALFKKQQTTVSAQCEGTASAIHQARRRANQEKRKRLKKTKKEQCKELNMPSYHQSQTREEQSQTTTFTSRLLALSAFTGSTSNSNNNNSLPRSAIPNWNRRRGNPNDKSTEFDNFPDFSRHAIDSPLRQILTPALYKELSSSSSKHTVTSLGVTVEDILKGALVLPWCSVQPVNGILCGDAESYTVFAKLLDPIIMEHHGGIKQEQQKQQHPKQQRTRLQRHSTNLDYRHLQPTDKSTTNNFHWDPQYILWIRLRLARSIQGFRFGTTITRGERRHVQELIRECCLNELKKHNTGGQYKAVTEMSNRQVDYLQRHQLLFSSSHPDPFLLASGLARDWPDGRGVYIAPWPVSSFPASNEIIKGSNSSSSSSSLQHHTSLRSITTPSAEPVVVLWCNAPRDHVWIMTYGNDVKAVFTKLSQTATALESALQKRGYSWVEQKQGYGFLNTSPADLGTALRASVRVKLIRLGQHKHFSHLVRQLGLDANHVISSTSGTSKYTGIVDIGNAQSLGKSEVELINQMIRGVGTMIALEKRLERGEVLSDSDMMATTNEEEEK